MCINRIQITIILAAILHWQSLSAEPIHCRQDEANYVEFAWKDEISLNEPIQLKGDISTVGDYVSMRCSPDHLFLYDRGKKEVTVYDRTTLKLLQVHDVSSYGDFLDFEVDKGGMIFYLTPRCLVQLDGDKIFKFNNGYHLNDIDVANNRIMARCIRLEGPRRPPSYKQFDYNMKIQFTHGIIEGDSLRRYVRDSAYNITYSPDTVLVTGKYTNEVIKLNVNSKLKQYINITSEALNYREQYNIDVSKSSRKSYTMYTVFDKPKEHDNIFWLRVPNINGNDRIVSLNNNDIAVFEIPNKEYGFVLDYDLIIDSDSLYIYTLNIVAGKALVYLYVHAAESN